MPPMHLEMKLAVPTVDRKSRLLRRSATRTLNRRQILRKYDASFQFNCAWILTLGQLDRATVIPKARPVDLAGGERASSTRECGEAGITREGDNQPQKT